MAASASLSAMDRHQPGLGLVVLVEATHFGEEWARAEFGDEWNTKKLPGTVVEYKAARGRSPAKWGLLFEGNRHVYYFNKDLMVHCGVPPRLLDNDAEAEHGQTAAEEDLRTPQSKGKGLAAADLPPAGRQLRERHAGRNCNEEDDSDDEEPTVSEEVDGGASEDGSGDSEGERAGRGAASLRGRGRGRERGGGSRTVTFTKQAAKPKGRKRVSKKLLEGDSSGDEENVSDEEPAEGVGPLDAPENEAGPSTEMEWQPVEPGNTVEDLQPPEFTGSNRRVKNIPNLLAATPLQLFLLLVPLSWWQFTVKQTNLYAERSREEQGLPDGRCRGWVPVTLQELLCWFGLVLAMALHPLPSLNRYWQSDVRGAIRFSGFGSFMSQKRFEQIKRYSHTNDNSQRPIDKGLREHRLWHLIPLVNELEETFKKYYNPGLFLTFDERMIPLRNRACAVRVYNPKKPHKFGAEVFCIVDSLTFYCFF
jgi:hypothetical protein